VFENLSSIYDFQINLIGFDEDLRYKFTNLPVKFIKWDSNNEIFEIQKFDVGIMPLLENEWNYGKCGFKLIQYMACSLPTISTPLPANIKINRDSNNLFASTEDEWFNAFVKVISNFFYFQNVGEKNYLIFEKYYSIEINSQKFLKILNQID
jgi:glycosyltransferase involved in cell wall biosynthesis